MKRANLGWIAILILVLGCKPQATSNNTSKSPARPSASTETRVQNDTPKTKISFEDVTKKSGIEHSILSGFESQIFGMPEIAGGGVGVIDFDLDGREDLVFAGGGNYPNADTISGRPGAIYQGLDDFVFKNVTGWTGFDASAAYNHGILIDDVDADGFDDILVAGYGAIQLFLNQGDGTFSRASEQMQLADGEWSTVAAASDVNLDGLLDVYVAHYGNWSLTNNPPCISDSLPGKVRVTCSPTNFPGIDHKLFVQSENGVFVDATVASKLSKGGRGFGVLCADFDADGDIDIYIANDEDVNYLYVNDGLGSFTEEALPMGCGTDPNGESQGSMGVAIGDYQKDGKADIIVTNFKNEQSALYAARKSSGYRFSTTQAGILKPDPTQVGWGTAFADFELDGDEDLVITNGHVDWQDPNYKQLANLYVNDKGRFQERTNEVGEYFTKRWPGRGLAILDHNQDGLLDMVITHQDEPSHILKNVSESQGSYLSVRLVGTRNNRNCVGAIVTYQDADGAVQLRHCYGGGSYLSTSQRNLHFSTAVKDSKEPIKLNIQWPGGRQEAIEIDRWNQKIVVVEPPTKDDASTWFPVR